MGRIEVAKCMRSAGARRHGGRLRSARRRSRSLGVQLPEIPSPSDRLRLRRRPWSWPRRRFSSPTPASSAALRRPTTLLDSAPTTLWLWFSERTRAPLHGDSAARLGRVAPIPLGQPTSIDAERRLTLAITRPLSRGAIPSYGVPPRPTATRRTATSRSASSALTPGAAAAPARRRDGHAGSGPARPVHVRLAKPRRPRRRYDGRSFSVSAARRGHRCSGSPCSPKAEWSAEAASATHRRARAAVAFAALALFAVTTVARVAIQSQLVARPIRRWRRSSPPFSDTRWGHGWRDGALGAVLALIGSCRRGTIEAWLVLAAFGAVLVCLSEALTGHAAARSHTALVDRHGRDARPRRRGLDRSACHHARRRPAGARAG